MTERPTLAVGLMSGTSLDGVDAALVRLDGPTRCELLGFESRPYSAAEREQILAAIAAGGARELALLHVRLSEWATGAVEAVLEHHRAFATLGIPVKLKQVSMVAAPGRMERAEDFPNIVSRQIDNRAVDKSAHQVSMGRQV